MLNSWVAGLVPSLSIAGRRHQARVRQRRYRERHAERVRAADRARNPGRRDYWQRREADPARREYQMLRARERRRLAREQRELERKRRRDRAYSMLAYRIKMRQRSNDGKPGNTEVAGVSAGA